MNNPDYSPPSSIDAEEAVLGAILINPESYWDIAAFLCSTDFFIARHMWVWDVIDTLMTRGDAVDNLTVSEELRIRGQLDDIGGHGYITHLINTTPTHIHAPTYGRLVLRAAYRRRYLNAAGKIAGIALEENIPFEEMVDKVDEIWFNVGVKSQDASSAPLSSIMSKTFDQMEYRYNNKDEKPGLPTGFPSLDAKLNGRLGKGKLYLVAGRPGMGKTAFLLNIALNAARLGNARVAIFNLEMDKQDELSYRLLSDETSISSQKLKDGDLNQDEWGLVTEATGNLCKLKITIDDATSLNVVTLRAKCRKIQREHGLDLLIIDYLQLMECLGTYRGNKNLEISEISRFLKLLARELNIPVLVACQLNREGDTSEPQLSHLRDSGSLEQDADVVIFIWRDVNKTANLANVTIAKQRGGELTKLEFGWNGTLTKFYDPPNPTYRKAA